MDRVVWAQWGEQPDCTVLTCSCSLPSIICVTSVHRRAWHIPWWALECCLSSMSAALMLAAEAIVWYALITCCAAFGLLLLVILQHLANLALKVRPRETLPDGAVDSPSYMSHPPGRACSWL